MSTTAEPTRADDRPIYHPLDRLRGTIRRFVLWDGLLVAGLFLVGWFWLGLVADYGLFRATAFDWVQEAPRGLRAAALAVAVLLLVAIVVRRVVLRLRREFSYPALALVLEKRFPDVLGDRLITAVELADVDRMARYGYSPDLIRHTIDAARERVATVPVDTVFNWRRLWTKGLLLAGLMVGLLGATYAGYAALSGTASPAAFGHDFGDVVAVWGERNLLLRHTPWPRRTHLELVGFPGDELRIGKDAPPPAVRARAFKWVVADRAARDGWRPLRASDLPRLVGETPVSAGGDDPTADELEAAGGAAWAALADKLAAVAADPTMSRTVRKLAVPADVTLSYRGEKTGGTVSLSRDQSGVFGGDVTGLKETVRFVVRAADFATHPRQITLLPPPALVSFTRTEYQPAYLYHPAPLAGPANDLKPDFDALKGLRQVFADKPLSLTGDRTLVTIPAGTELEITGTADKELASVTLMPKAKGAADPAARPIPVPVSGKSFTASFRGPNVLTQTTEFELTLTDPDGVTARRGVLIQVTDDQPPTVELAVDVLRRQGPAYLCTPIARVPFVRESVIRDDTGLSRVEFEFTYTRQESEAVVDVQNQLPGSVAGGAAVAAMPRAEKKAFGRAAVGRFADSTYGDYARLPKYTVDGLKARLTRPVDADRPDVVRQVKLQDPDADGFDIEQSIRDLRPRDPDDVPPRYRVELNVVATDANVESGPKAGRNLETIRLLVVSEQDLLAEMSKDEETQVTRLDEVIKRLTDAQNKLTQMADRLASAGPPPDVIVAASVRSLDILQDVGKGRDGVNAVVTEYTRLRREAEVNRLNPAFIKKIDDIPLGLLPGIVTTEFAAAEAALTAVQGPLSAGQRPADDATATAKRTMADLLSKLTAVRAKLGDAVNISKLRDDLRKILEQQLLVSKAIKEIKTGLVRGLLSPKLLPVPAITLAKGEKKTIKQGINWNAYVDGAIQVRLTAPDASGLKLPAELKVPDDRDDFEYELTAGQTAGEFTVTVTPSVGDPVAVKVVVK